MVTGTPPQSCQALMFPRIRWDLLLTTKNLVKAQRVVRWFCETVGGSELISIEAPANASGGCRAKVESTLDAASVEAAVFQVLLVAQRVAPYWLVGPPYRLPGSGAWYFSGSAERLLRTVGIEGISFSIEEQ